MFPQKGPPYKKNTYLLILKKNSYIVELAANKFSMIELCTWCQILDSFKFTMNTFHTEHKFKCFGLNSEFWMSDLCFWQSALIS